MVKRFIAGAVCPRCGEMDKLVVDSEAKLRECVSCGFQDQQPQQALSEVDTRVNRAAARLVETSAEPLRFTESDQDEE